MVVVPLALVLTLCVGPEPALSASTGSATSGPVGPLRAPGGPLLVDRFGRTVLLHGVDLVYKVPPYEVEVSGSGATC